MFTVNFIICCHHSPCLLCHLWVEFVWTILCYCEQQLEMWISHSLWVWVSLLDVYDSCCCVHLISRHDTYLLYLNWFSWFSFTTCVLLVFYSRQRQFWQAVLVFSIPFCWWLVRIASVKPELSVVVGTLHLHRPVLHVTWFSKAFS